MFGDGVHRKFEGNATAVADAVFDAFDQVFVDDVAGGEVAACLGDANDGFAGLEFFAGPAVVHEAFDVDGGHAHVVGVVEPFLAS